MSIVGSLMQIRPDRIVVADTIGVAVPKAVGQLVRAVVSTGIATGAHFHNTRNTGYANAIAAIDAGATMLDSSVGGAGGCPFAPDATGNIATEDLVYMLEGSGFSTGIDLSALIGTSKWLASRLGKELPGMVASAGPFRASPDCTNWS
jgi:hydroxymethylglutaryl-CoA lyase/(R)-citramalyl-CoA lyase